MYFLLPGPFDISVGSGIIEFGSGRQRAILALPLLQRGQIVRGDNPLTPHGLSVFITPASCMALRED